MRGACVLGKRSRYHSPSLLWSPCHGATRGRSPAGPHCRSPIRGRGGPSPPPTAVPSEGRGCLIVTVDVKGADDEGLVLPLVSSSPFFFSSKTQEIDLSLLSHKRGRFVG
jgi:hypothetical protein